jgi:prepilin-type N-terminal cleavage/methylation domain-containing protein/prepilin-type processing-associated H-X9-DG protein
MNPAEAGCHRPVPPKLRDSGFFSRRGWQSGPAAAGDRLRSCSGKGFNLIELLVTVTVIGILATLMLPALASAKHKARGIICLNHLRQWGLATQLYVNDHDDYLPSEGTPNPGESSTSSGWYIQLPRMLDLPPYHAMLWRTNAEAPVASTVWLCPSNPRRSNGRNLFHYCLNAHVNGTGEASQPVRHASIPYPSSVVWLFDSKNLPAVGYWGYVHTNIHGGGANFTFLDGHASRFRKEAYWDEATNKGRTDNPEIRWVP